jgi:hypothetical protein
MEVRARGENPPGSRCVGGLPEVGGAAGVVARRGTSNCARRAPSPPAPLPRGAGERGEFDRAPEDLPLWLPHPTRHMAGTCPCLDAASPRRRASCRCCSEFIRPCPGIPTSGRRRCGGSTKNVELRPTGPPLPRPLSPAEREKGENSIALRKVVSRPTSPSSLGGGGRVMRARRGRPRTQVDRAEAPPPAVKLLPLSPVTCPL